MATHSRMTRRGMLGRMVAAAAAPYFVPAITLGWAGNARAGTPALPGRAGTPVPPRVSAGERITLGIIGVGNMGGGHVDTFLGNPDVQIVAICDVFRKKRDEAAAKVEKHYAAERESGVFKGCETYNEYERLLEREDIDAVLIAVPDHWHATIAVAACRAGKDVYCEKPLALTIREAREMVRAARRYGTIFQVGSQQRSDRNFRYACELVRNGRIGKLKTVHVGIGGTSSDKFLPEEPIPEGLDWERWLGPSPWHPYNSERASGSYSGGWRLIRDTSGGMMTDWGAHHFDIAQWGMGRDGSGPVEITPPDGRDVKELTYRYDDGVLMYHGGANGVLFTGTGGRIEVNRGYFKTWPDEIGQVPIGPNEIHLYKSDNHQQNWIDCIRTRRTPICDVAIGCSSVTVCHLGNIAFWTGRAIRWDPAKEEILGDEAAARWLDRPKRAPYRLHA